MALAHAVRRLAVEPALAAVALALLWSASAAPAAPAAPRSQEVSTTITIGAAQDISAGWTALGRASRVTLELAAADANAALARQGSSTRVRLRLVDTHGTPEGAVSAVRELAGDGAKFIVGPPTSSGVRAVRKEAGRLGVIVISQGSTAHSLAIPGDNVFRFVPDDVREGEALVALLRRRHVGAVVPVWRRDAGNAGLAISIRRLFSAAGGKVSRGVSYGEDVTSFSPVVSSIAKQVATLRARGARHVAVYLAAFDEVVDLFRVAALSRVLEARPWYGSDGVALTPRLIGDPQAAAFARHVGYPNPTVGLPAAVRRRARPLVRRTHAKLGRDPDALALTAYDALRIAVIAQQRATGTSAASLRSALTSAANGHVGVTGKMVLNRAGDRAYGTFDFWSVCPTGRRFRWERTAEYVASAVEKGRIVGDGRC